MALLKGNERRRTTSLSVTKALENNFFPRCLEARETAGIVGEKKFQRLHWKILPFHPTVNVIEFVNFVTTRSISIVS